MAGEIALSLLAIVVAYLLGSIPSAYIVGRLMKGVDLREVGDGRIGMANTYRRVGVLGAVIVGLMDLTKGALAVLLAQRLGLAMPVLLLVAICVVGGHNWSIFLNFKGGKGAMTTYGVLITLFFWQFLIALAFGGVVYFFTHKSGMSTGILLGFLSFLTWLTGNVVLLIVLPVLISLPMVLKHIFMPKPGTMASIEGVESKGG